MIFANLETYILPFVVLAPTLGACTYILLSVIPQMFLFILKVTGHNSLNTQLTFLKRPNATFGAIICSLFTMVAFIGLLYALDPLKTDFQLVSTTQ